MARQGTRPKGRSDPGTAEWKSINPGGLESADARFRPIPAEKPEGEKAYAPDD